MVTRRNLIGAALAAGAYTATSRATAFAAGHGALDVHGVTANGWSTGARDIATYRIAGSAATVMLRNGPSAAVLLHIARRWHYEIGPLDTGEGGGVIGYSARPHTHEDLAAHYLSGTAIAVHPAAYPPGGSERLWPLHELIVQDILADCGGVVVWGGHLTPATASHFHVAGAPGDRALPQVAARLDTGRPGRSTVQTPGAVADPAGPDRRAKARPR